MKKIIGIIFLVTIITFALSSCGSSNYENAVIAFESGDFSNAAELFESMLEGKHSEECKKYLSAIKYLEKAEGLWTDDLLYNDNTDWNYYGSQWRAGKIEVKLGPPYSITSAIHSDGDWGIEATVNITATLDVLTGGNGGDMSVKNFSYNGKGNIDHITGDAIDTFDDYFTIINEQGKCLFTPKKGTNSLITMRFKDNEAVLNELPCNYDWSEHYINYGESITLNKK